MKFSQRIGKTEIRKQIQLDHIDEELRNGLWDIYRICFLDALSNENRFGSNTSPLRFAFNSIWHHHFKKPIDAVPNLDHLALDYIRKYFFSCEWFKLYDFIEYVVDLSEEEKFDHIVDRVGLVDGFNGILERESSGYRFINEMLSPITNENEISSLEESFSFTDSFTSLKSCNIHLKTALQKLSDRQNPDFRNSIKESISAVESLAKIISNNANDTLGASLDKIKGKLKIHQSLELGFKKIYGYTSDADGIRPALTEEATTCDFEDAKFMLITCSAFINYLIVKADKAGIVFQ